jgi:hypothetical protein
VKKLDRTYPDDCGCTFVAGILLEPPEIWMRDTAQTSLALSAILPFSWYVLGGLSGRLPNNTKAHPTRRTSCRRRCKDFTPVELSDCRVPRTKAFKLIFEAPDYQSGRWPRSLISCGKKIGWRPADFGR